MNDIILIGFGGVIVIQLLHFILLRVAINDLRIEIKKMAAEQKK